MRASQHSERVSSQIVGEIGERLGECFLAHASDSYHA